MKNYYLVHIHLENFYYLCFISFIYFILFLFNFSYSMFSSYSFSLLNSLEMLPSSLPSKLYVLHFFSPSCLKKMQQKTTIKINMFS